VKLINWIIIGLIVFIIIGMILLYQEVSSAKKFCDSANGSYKLDWGNYSCDGKPIAKYIDGWDYERDPSKIEINISGLYS
jgi:hypothetical protein